MTLPRDIQEFLRGYPGYENDLTSSINWEFYAELPVGQPRKCVPNDMSITELHDKYALSPCQI